MGTTAQKLQAILTSKAAIKAAIEAKGVTVDDAPLDEYAWLIADIPNGSGTDTSDATATAADIASGKTAYVASGKVTGTMPENKFKSLVDGTIQTITAEDLQGVTTVVNYRFSECNNLTSVDLPNGVVSVGVGCFQVNPRLERVTFPSSGFTTIGNRAFYYCRALQKIVIPGSVTTIGNTVFQDCNALLYVLFLSPTPPTLNNSNSFSNTNDCAIYTLASSLAAYKSATNWSALSSRLFGISISISHGTYTITDLETISITPNANFTFPASVTVTGATASYDSTTGVISLSNLNGDITISAACDGFEFTQVSDSEYAVGTIYCGKASLSIPVLTPEGDPVVAVYAGACVGNTYITSLTIPDEITTIGGNNANGGAFENCTSLETVVIGSGITSIGKSAFSGCSALTSITINATTPPTLEDYYAFYNTNDCDIFVPAGSVTAYQQATNWSALASRIFPLVSTVADLANIDTTTYTKACVIGTDKSYKEYTYDGSQWNEVT